MQPFNGTDTATALKNSCFFRVLKIFFFTSIKNWQYVTNLPIVEGLVKYIYTDRVEYNQSLDGFPDNMHKKVNEL